MTVQFSSSRLTEFFTRAKLVLLHPKACWITISRERYTPKIITATVLLPLATAAVIGPVIGHKIFGVDVEFFGLWRAPLFHSLTNQSLVIAMLLASLFLDALMLNKLAPHFYRSITFNKAFALVAYASIPILIAWTLGIIPGLLFVKPLAFLYSLFILFFGIEEMTSINENAPKNDTKVAFFSGAAAIMIVIHVLTQGLVEPIDPSPFFDIAN